MECRSMSRTTPQPDQHVMGFVLPPSEWTRPTELPDLVAQGVKQIALDLETKDDGIRLRRGAGWATGAGHICGVSVAWAGGSLYAPIAHPETECFDTGAVLRWLDALLGSDVEVVTQNGSYDYGWLGALHYRVSPPARVQDTMIAAYMLDENLMSYALGSLCAAEGIPGKDDAALIEAGRTMGLGTDRRSVMSNLWRLPAKHVGAYAEADAVATLVLWARQAPKLAEQGLDDAYRLEMDLMPMCVEMRRRGVRVDTDGAERSAVGFRVKRDEALARLTELVPVGRAVTIEDVRSARWLEGVFQSSGLHFSRTLKNEQGQFKSDWMEKHPHEIPRLVAAARGYEDAAGKFCEGFLLEYAHRGRLHAEIHQTRSEDGGTRSYRFSYSDPPLQQMPSPKRDRELGLAIRRLFLPEEGERWGSVDYSQQEYRLMVNDAVLMHLPGAEAAAARYRDDPDTDFHQMVADMTGLERKPAKDANFAHVYGAGVAKFALMIGKSEDEARAIMERYDEELPFPKRLTEAAKSTAANRGFIKLLDGARCRFDTWEPGYGYRGRYHGPCRRPEAEARVARGSGHNWEGAQLRRAFTHKAMNRRIQGSAARQTKLAMREMWRQGIVPLLQLHDELDVSGDEALVRRVQAAMVEAVTLRVPMKADASIGSNWADQEKVV